MQAHEEARFSRRHTPTPRSALFRCSPNTLTRMRVGSDRSPEYEARLKCLLKAISVHRRRGVDDENESPLRPCWQHEQNPANDVRADRFTCNCCRLPKSRIAWPYARKRSR